MTYQRLSVPLTTSERDALLYLAQDERRDPRDQAALLVRRGLESAGYLPLPVNGKLAGPAPATSNEVLNYVP